MAVYVDDMEAPFANMIMCHMIADTHEELLAMATRIGVAHKWIQSAGNHGEHFDVSKEMRRKALAAGAKEISWRDLSQMCRERRQEENKTKYFAAQPKQESLL